MGVVMELGRSVVGGSIGCSVQLKELAKSFGDLLVAVDRISIEIKSNEFLTLLGPSGSGKTTTLMMIAGFELPSSGDIFFDNSLMTYVPAYKRDVGVVFQNYALFPHMTVYDNIAFPLKMRRLSGREIKEKVEAALELVKLPAHSSRYPKQLSGGQQQRVALARAIVFSPRLLLMDEPLGALDRKLRQDMQLEIKALHRKLGKTIVYVTHDQEEALTLSDRVALMRHGRIEQIGTSADLYERPANQFVADFVGESNFLEGRVAEVQDRLCLVVTKGGLEVAVPCQAGVQPGQRAILSVRPERIFVTGDVCDGSQVFEGRVENVIYCGDVIKLRVILSSEDECVMVKMQNRSNLRGFMAGKSVTIGWESRDVKLFVGDMNVGEKQDQTA